MVTFKGYSHSFLLKQQLKVPFLNNETSCSFDPQQINAMFPICTPGILMTS